MKVVQMSLKVSKRFCIMQTDDYLYKTAHDPDGSPVCTCFRFSAGFTTTTITEPDTSTGGTNPDHGCGSYGAFTVPCGVTRFISSFYGVLVVVHLLKVLLLPLLQVVEVVLPQEQLE